MTSVLPPSGPVATAIWRALPYLEPVAAEVLDGGPAEDAAVLARELAGGRLCLVCGKAAFAAIVARPSAPLEVTPPGWAGAAWADLCLACSAVLAAEQP